ncbi:MAG TPA: HAMP domain-containing sensor histidine kinase [Polyangiaceae bacterium]|nr:HAMP domain-containing sensor histidine kinase [Polyangiaceae bacterium]
MTGQRFPRSRLLLRVYLYGVLLLALAGGASFLVGRFVLTPAVEVPVRPATAWLAWHLLDSVGEPERLARELTDVKRRAHVEMTLFDAQGQLIATNATHAPPPLREQELALLASHGTEFKNGTGVVAVRDAAGQVLRYARTTYPQPEVPLGTAMAQLAAALAVLAVLSIPLARSISAPLEQLSEVTRAFGAGDLSVRSGLKSQDEIGDLARALDDMADRVVELRKTERELLANVSHELRTPLARIRMALELVREGDAPSAAGYLTDIEDDLGELERLLDDVMTAARLEIARGTASDALPPLRLKRVSAEELVEASRARFEKRVPGRRLEHRVAPDAPDVEADPSLLRRVVDNLLDNAAKFSEASTPIELEATRDQDGGLKLEVRDHGIGIDPAELERIFEPFYRTDRSRARTTGGVGLGLALARRIALAHGGQITAASGPEKGSRFRLVVPRAPG